MAHISAHDGAKIFGLTKFLGLYECPDGDTQRPGGAASAMKNWMVTEHFHLKTRPGMVPQAHFEEAVRGLWSGYLWGRFSRVAVAGNGVYLYTDGEWTRRGELNSTDRSAPVNIFEFQGTVYFQDGEGYYSMTEAWGVGAAGGYAPLVVTASPPSGGGTALQAVNLLSNERRVRFSPDGTAAEFILPEPGLAYQIKLAGETCALPRAATQLVCAVTVSPGRVVFGEAPGAGVNTLEVWYRYGSDSHALLSAQRFCEQYNGATDSRVFLYGGGTNLCYYSGLTDEGAPTADYFPAGNEIAVDESNSPIVAMSRHYSRLLAFKRDGVYAISYDALTLADGSVTAGFYVRPMHKGTGASAPGQVVTVGNLPRTFCGGSLYAWKQSASFYRDERDCRVCSEPVQFTLREADENRLFLYDDDTEHRFYAFLNDAAGTVLVNAYAQEVWFLYTGFYGVQHAVREQDGLVFSSGTELFRLSAEASGDFIPNYQQDGSFINYTRRPIPCHWESGHLSFGSEHRRKNSAQLWVSLKPAARSHLYLTAKTDRCGEYDTKEVTTRHFPAFSQWNFADFSFRLSAPPGVVRVKLKVKKFIYYKLCLSAGTESPETAERITAEDRSVTVLGVEQKVRFTGAAN